MDVGYRRRGAEPHGTGGVAASAAEPGLSEVEDEAIGEVLGQQTVFRPGRLIGDTGAASGAFGLAALLAHAEVDAIGTPFQLCPQTPADCPAYDTATDAAILTQLHTVFAGAAVAAGLAAIAALVLLRDVRSSTRS